MPPYHLDRGGYHVLHIPLILSNHPVYYLRILGGLKGRKVGSIENGWDTSTESDEQSKFLTARFRDTRKRSSDVLSARSKGVGGKSARQRTENDRLIAERKRLRGFPNIKLRTCDIGPTRKYPFSDSGVPQTLARLIYQVLLQDFLPCRTFENEGQQVLRIRNPTPRHTLLESLD